MHGLAYLAILVCVGCNGPRDEPEPGFDCEAEDHPRCEHPLDRILIPQLRRAHVPLEVAPPDEACRRLYVDLVDRGPSPDERAACAADFDGVAARLLASVEHVDAQRQRWMELLAVDFTKISTQDVVDLDARIAALERGQLAYADFVTAVASHPGFYSLHSADDWFGSLIPIFLGRPAYQNELIGLRPLTRMWQVTDFYIEGAVWWRAYRQGIEGGSSDAESVDFANMSANNRARTYYALNPCACSPGESNAGCASTTLGKRIEITAACTDPSSPADRSNARRLAAYQPGQRDDCFGGGTRPECADRSMVDFVSTYAPWVPIAQGDAVLAADVAEIGAALAARSELWEAAADRELKHLLGWWQTTFKHPDSDLPEIRDLLAERMRGGASPLEVRRLIVTSLLYRLPATPPAEIDDPDLLPPWAMGPTKILAGEGWLRSAAHAVGEIAAYCDARWVTRAGIDIDGVDERIYEFQAGTIDSYLLSLGAYAAVGGCSADMVRPTRSNIGLAYAQAQLARSLCARGRGVVPPGWNDDLGVAAEHLSQRIFARPADDRAELVREMQLCLADGACTGPETAARWLCRRMIDSAEFATY